MVKLDLKRQGRIYVTWKERHIHQVSNLFTSHWRCIFFTDGGQIPRTTDNGRRTTDHGRRTTDHGRQLLDSSYDRSKNKIN